jgi:hypothetical protein
MVVIASYENSRKLILLGKAKKICATKVSP